jgi:hypothetical protein
MSGDSLGCAADHLQRFRFLQRVAAENEQCGAKSQGNGAMHNGGITFP